MMLFSAQAYAYPQFIGKGYQACLTCHYNPFGNGALTDYGRGVSANVIADRLFISPQTTDEQLGENSGFFYSKPSQKWFRPSLDYRGIQLDRDINKERPNRKYIHMQMEANVTLKFGATDNYIASFTQGVIPRNSARLNENGEQQEIHFSREHYIGYRPLPELGIYLGKMDKIFGLRIPDHTAFSKKNTNLNQYSSAKGALVHWGREAFDIGVQLFNGEGDIEKKASEQTKGHAVQAEYSFWEKSRTGISLLNEKDIDDNERRLMALHSKIGVGNGSSVMIEIGQQHYQAIGKEEQQSRYFFMQNHILLHRGFYFMLTLEQYQPNTAKGLEYYVLSPGLQYFPWQGVEIRAELSNQRIFNDDNSNPVSDDSWNFLGQLHLWF
jgi:hypothetical protein